MRLHGRWLIFVLIFGALSAGAQEKTPLENALAVERALIDAIAEAENSIVAITRVRKAPGGGGPKPLDADFFPNELGTGVVIDRDGSILTAYHLLGDVKKNDYFVWVNKASMGKVPWSTATVKGGDTWTDLAVLKIDQPENLKLHPIRFAPEKSFDLKKGQFVIALGDPYAIMRDGEVAAARGMISNLRRRAVENPRREKPFPGASTLHHYGTLIQHDAQLAFGRSGGALVNLKGEMIGLTTSLPIMPRYQNAAGFAIPIEKGLQRIIDRLKAGKEAEFGFLGVKPSEVAISRGVQLDIVVSGTPAGIAGLRPGDIITHIDGKEVNSHIDLMRDLGKLPVESNIELTVTRRGLTGLSIFKARVKLSKKYVETFRPSYAQSKRPKWRGMKIDYATAVPLIQRNARLLDFPGGCVAVVDVEPSSPAWKAGMRPGTFISHVGEKQVATPKEFHRAVANQTGSVVIRLTAPQGGVGPLRIIEP
ncbi:MAG: PDZ domain-containing protein [Planctomycetes bacterium]|nr:PDZ domain-containing protein [Planctomycetota bacterium]